jgi:hypothetical protein
MKAEDYAKLVGPLEKDKKVLFYELLAHRLTIAARVVWNNHDLSDGEKVERLKWLNEIQHRVTAKIRVERMEVHPWPEDEFCEMITKYVKKCVTISSEVGWAISGAFEQLEKHESKPA